MLWWCVGAGCGCVVLRIFWFVLRLSQRRSLRGAAVLVTGCDSGLGFAIAQRLSEESAIVFAACLTEAGMEACQKLGSRVKPLRLDVTKPEDVQHAAHVVRAELGGLQLLGLVNNAGLGNYGFAEQLPLERYEETLAVNCLGTVRVTKAFLHMLRKHGAGRLVTIGSLSGRVPAGFGSGYVPTKAYVASFTECIGAETRSFGIRASIVEPGFVATGLLSVGRRRGQVHCETAKECDLAYGVFDAMMTRVQRKVEACERLNELGGGSKWVADAVVDALSSSFPRSRYLVGFDAILLGSILPRIPGYTRLLGMFFSIEQRVVHEDALRPSGDSKVE